METRLTTPALLVAVALFPLAARAPVPRESPEFTFLNAQGSETSLSSFKGKVVLIEFLLTDCPHCLRVAQTIGNLHRDLGPIGFQPLGIVFEDNASWATVADFARKFGITYPVGYTTSAGVDRYLGRDAAERFQVPQIVVIDRHGVVREQSRPVGEIRLEDEVYLRTLIRALLQDGRAPWMSAVATVPPVALLVLIAGALVWKRRRPRPKNGHPQRRKSGPPSRA
jgi:peroxiredoxin